MYRPIGEPEGSSKVTSVSWWHEHVRIHLKAVVLLELAGIEMSWYNSGGHGRPAAGADSPDILAAYSYCLSWKGMLRPVGEPEGSSKVASVSWWHNFLTSASLPFSCSA
jgi:hypothetical protein